MKADRKRLDEAARIRALHRYDVLDTEKEKPFEKIVGLVQQILNVPICAVSLV
ncbi:MAG: sensor domain-containing diguanylate cyclase, partial [Cyanothece sp. SIO1E1]|nr:sensor domain-containing diguanylate cyclase [Cyanothece sp. SIO1E1]